MANSWLHPLKHNREQRRKARAANLRAAEATKRQAQRLEELGRYEEAAFERSCIGMWAMADPGFFPPWAYEGYGQEPTGDRSA